MNSYLVSVQCASHQLNSQWLLFGIEIQNYGQQENQTVMEETAVHSVADTILEIYPHFF